MSKVMTRDEVKVEETWNVSTIFETDEAWERAYEEVDKLLERAPSYAGTFSEGAEAIVKALHYRDEVLQQTGKVYVYAHLKHDEDTSNGTYQAMESRAASLYAKVGTALSFLSPELLSVDEDTLQRYVEQNEELAQYAYELEEFNAQRAHILPKEQEAILAQMSEVTGASSDTFGKLNNADLTFPEVTNEKGERIELTHGRFIQLMESSNRDVRKEAFDAMYETYGQFKNTFASTLTGVVKSHNVSARIRGFESAREAALSSNRIPEAVYDQLVETINEHLPLLHRYVTLRKHVLGLDEHHMYDIYTPLVKDVEMKMTYEEAAEKMVDSFEPLGEEYQSIVRKGLNERWVDVRENKGKRSGAYSSGTYGTNPFILMNWQDNVDNLFTLAHEFGHSVHSYYSRANQPYHYSGYTIFVAEVASTVNEALLNEYLLETTEDEEERKYLLNHWLDGFRGTVFRQTMFAEFEHLIHELDAQGVALTADRLSEEYYRLNEKYFGDDMVIDEEIALEWARIPHFYYNYYVYQYATGYSAAVALSGQILKEGQPAVERYVNEFLKAGSSDTSINILKRAGVDMTSAQPIREACEMFERRLTELEQLLMK